MKHSAQKDEVAIRPQKQINDVSEVEVEAEEATESTREAKDRIKKMLDPKLPSAEDRDLHMLTHLPYRNWCEHCVKGRGREMDHKKTTEKRDTIEFHMDFCFPGEEDASEKLTMLVVRERSSRMTMASVVPSKSSGMFISKRVVAFMRELGCQSGTFIIKSDQEAAMKCIIRDVTKQRVADGEVNPVEHVVEETRSIVEHSPVGSSASNGVVERAIRSVEEHLRVMRDALETRCGIRLGPCSALWTWMAEYAAVLLNRAEIGHDGKTSYERLKGKHARIYGLEFGEKMLWKRKPISGALGKLTCLWEVGIFLGIKSTTGEFVVGDEKGIWKTRTVHRKPVGERWDGDVVAKVIGVPWKMSTEDPEADGDELPAATKIMGDAEVKEESENMASDAVPRSFPITAEDLIKYGYSSGCPGCKATLRGTVKQKHSPGCRARLLKEMKGEEKVKRAVQKENEFLEKALIMGEAQKEKEREAAEAKEKKEGKKDEGKPDVDIDEEEANRGKKKQKIVHLEQQEEPGKSSSWMPEVETGEKKSRKRNEREEDKEEQQEEGERSKKKLMIANIRTLKEIKDACPTPHEKDEDEVESWSGEGDYFEETSDSLSGKILDQKLVEEAKSEEVDFIEGIPVYEIVDEKESWKETGKAPTSAKWVNVNKGSDEKPEIRCRWVARDFKPRGEKDREDLFADMPPIEAKRLLLRLARISAMKKGKVKKLKVLVIDVRKAHLNPLCGETVYVQIPRESKGFKEGKCGKLKRWLYGFRPAAQAWQGDYTDKLVEVGFKVGKASKVIFYHPEWDVRGVVHGDDFTFVGEERELKKVRDLMEEWYEVKVKGMLGGDARDCKEMALLNRRLNWEEDFLDYQADPKHVQKILEDLNLPKGSKGVISPIVRESPEEELDGDELLDAEGATTFRGIAARCNYLAQDRTDIAFATKTICKEMSSPTVRSQRRLKRLGRYLLNAKTAKIRYHQAPEVNRIDVYTDSDWAGDRQNRKSTSGGILCVGGCAVKTWSKSQSVVARSSGEAEFYALNKGLTEGLGLRSLAKDMGLELDIRVHVDSSAAKSLVSRTGLGKNRHIEVEYLWSQDVLKEKFVCVKKILGTENPADVCTKPLSKVDMKRLLAKVNILLEDGE